MTETEPETYKPIVTGQYEVLDSYVEGIVNHFKSAFELVEEYFARAKDLGISEEEAKAYLKSKLPKTTFYRALPDQYKDHRKQNQKPLLDKKFGPTWDQKAPEQENSNHEFNTEGMGVAIIEEEDQHEQELGPNEIRGRDNIAPEEYELEHLSEYDKDLLIDIIKYLDKRLLGHDALYNKIDILKRELDKSNKENAELREELEEHKPAIERLQRTFENVDQNTLAKLYPNIQKRFLFKDRKQAVALPTTATVRNPLI